MSGQNRWSTVLPPTPACTVPGIESIDKRSIDVLRIYEGPGNIRELRNTVERAVILANGPRLHISAPNPPTNGTTISLVMEDIEREHLRKVLEMTGWRIRGKDGAAEILDVKPTTLESRIAKLNLARKNVIN